MHFVNSSPDNQKFVEYKQRNMFQILELLLKLDTEKKVMKESFIEYLSLIPRKLSLGFPKKGDSNHSAQLQRLARKLKFCL